MLGRAAVLWPAAVLVLGPGAVDGPLVLVRVAAGCLTETFRPLEGKEDVVKVGIVAAGSPCLRAEDKDAEKGEKGDHSCHCVFQCRCAALPKLLLRLLYNHHLGRLPTGALPVNAPFASFTTTNLAMTPNRNGNYRNVAPGESSSRAISYAYVDYLTVLYSANPDSQVIW